MVGKEYKTKLSVEEINQKLKNGEKVKAVDMLSAMGIKVINFE